EICSSGLQQLMARLGDAAVIPDLLRQRRYSLPGAPFMASHVRPSVITDGGAECTHLLRQDWRESTGGNRTGGGSGERGRVADSARPGRAAVRPAPVVRSRGRAVPNRRGHREVLRTDLEAMPLS